MLFDMTQKRAPGVVIYRRTATARQSSLSAQSEACRRLAARHGWEVKAVYTDADVSGNTTKRPGLQKMVRDAQDGGFDVVIVSEFDRLSRSMTDLPTILHDLEAQGIVLISIADQFDSRSPSSRIMQAVLDTFTQ